MPEALKIPTPVQTYVVYVLGSYDACGRRTYVGCTTDMDRRLAEHNSGTGARSTRGREWRVLYTESAQNRSAAQAREYVLKKDRGFRKMLATHLPCREYTPAE
ncbi:MAG: GIY-YIG nuclease family protein [Alphaproteobacteria bacterium]|nr:GIY-YIG nuclease family protein [Alphaproteobacteria bacterium]